jgi:uncharacterized protein (TIGR02145 family)
MKENLKVGTMVDSINTGSVHSDQTNENLLEKYCYNNTLSNCDIYGGLYEWQEMMNLPATCMTTICSIQTPHQGICPNGWHIPTDTEFNTLEKYTIAIIGSSATQYECSTSPTNIGWQRCADATDPATDAGGPTGAGKSLKKVGQGSGVGAGDDLVGFSALFAGSRGTSGSFGGLATLGYFWQAMQYSSTLGWHRYLTASYSTVRRNVTNKANGFSVRCLKD